MIFQYCNKTKVMIVDSCHESCTNMQQVLINSGITEEVYITNNAFEALEKLPVMQPDIVILELVLPHMDGIAFLEQAVRITGILETKYIVTSTIANESTIQHVQALGAAYYMMKPLNYDYLCKRIQMLCNKVYPETNDPGCSASNDTDNLEKSVTKALLSLGIPPNINGYRYMRYAIMLAIEDPDAIIGITKNLYPAVAKRFATNVNNVERSIRHAISILYKRGDFDQLSKIFVCPLFKGRNYPTNGEFIATIAEKIGIEHKKLNQLPAR